MEIEINRKHEKFWIPMQGQYWYFLKPKSLKKKKCFEFDMSRKNQASGYAETGLRVDMYKNWERFGILGPSGFWPREQKETNV